MSVESRKSSLEFPEFYNMEIRKYENSRVFYFCENDVVIPYVKGVVGAKKVGVMDSPVNEFLDCAVYADTYKVAEGTYLEKISMKEILDIVLVYMRERSNNNITIFYPYKIGVEYLPTNTYDPVFGARIIFRGTYE